MNYRTVLEALVSGGKTAVLSSVLGGLGLLVYTFLVDERVIHLSYALAALAIVSVLLGGIQGGLAARTVGWLHGCAVACFYLCLLLIFRTVVTPSLGYSPAGFIFALGILCAGGAGGVLGVNLSFARQRSYKRRYMSY